MVKISNWMKDWDNKEKWTFCSGEDENRNEKDAINIEDEIIENSNLFHQRGLFLVETVNFHKTI